MTQPSKSPAFQFYPNDFVGSGKVGVMTTEEVGAYVLLLCLEWNENGFTYDAAELSRWCRMSRRAFESAWRRVSNCFVERDGRMYNPRLDLERKKQADWREKSRKGGLSKRQPNGKGGSTTLEPPYEPNANQKPTLQSPTPVSTTKLLPRPAAQPWVVKFAEIWTARVGHVTHGHVGKVLKPLVEAHGVERVERAMLAYIATRNASSQVAKLSWFATEAAMWIGKTTGPIDVVDGEMTDTLELLTRPGRMAS